MPFIIGNPIFSSIDEISAGRGGTPYSMDGQRDYTRRFRVGVKIQEVNEIIVSHAPGLPIGGSFYISGGGTEYDLLAILNKKSAKQEGGEDAWHNWIVECNYSTRIKSKNSEGTQNNPENERPDVSWDFETIKVALQTDLKNKPFLNSAAMPFTPAPTFDIGMACLIIGRNELGFDSQKASNYAFALNKDKFLGYPAGTVQCMPPKAKQVWRGSKMFWRVDYKLRFAPKIPDPDEFGGYIYMPFQPKLVDKGMHHLDLDPASPKFNKPIPIFDNGPLNHEVLLNGAGQRAPEVPPVPRYRDFTIYDSVSFNTLIVQGLA